MLLKLITAIIVFVVVASLSVAGCATNNQYAYSSTTPSSSTSSDKTTFSSPKGFSITYPNTWWNVSNDSMGQSDLYLQVQALATAT
jgi:hypothetical protein